VLPNIVMKSGFYFGLQAITVSYHFITI